MATGDIHKFGTLYVDDMRVRVPDYPYRIDTPINDIKGDIFDYSTMKGAIEIRDDYKLYNSDKYIMNWVEVNYNNKKIFICNKCMLASIQYNRLIELGIVHGKLIEINNKFYLLRLIDGGNDFRDGTSEATMKLGANPVNNEWDYIIGNEGNFPNLPTPTANDINFTTQEEMLQSPHNKFWNWVQILTLAKDEFYNKNGASTTVRGYTGAKRVNYHAKNYSDKITKHIGWRPVLEDLDSIIKIEVTSNTTSSSSPFIINYKINNTDNSKFELTERVNNTIIRKTSNNSNGNYSIDLTNYWNNMLLGDNEVEILISTSSGLKNRKLLNIFKDLKVLTNNNSLEEVTSNIEALNTNMINMNNELKEALKKIKIDLPNNFCLKDIINNIKKANLRRIESGQIQHALTYRIQVNATLLNGTDRLVYCTKLYHNVFSFDPSIIILYTGTTEIVNFCIISDLCSPGTKTAMQFDITNGWNQYCNTLNYIFDDKLKQDGFWYIPMEISYGKYPLKYIAIE